MDANDIPDNELNQARVVPGQRQNKAEILRTDVTDRDVVDLMVVEHEEALIARRKELQAALASKQAEQKTALEALNAVCTEQAEKKLKPALTKAADAMKPVLGTKYRIRVQAGYAEREEGSFVAAQGTAYFGDTQYPVVQVQNVQLELSAAVKSARVKFNKINEEVAGLMRLVGEADHQIRNLPYAERRLRAKITKQKLNSADPSLTKEVQGFLKELHAEIPKLN